MIFTDTNIAKTTESYLNRLFPEFGSRGLDIPSWDSGKGMYLVDQYQSASGNRSLTYVGVSDQLLIEMTIGHYHSWEFINKVRVMVYDGKDFKVICSHDWEQSTHFNKQEILPLVVSAMTEYVMKSGFPGGLSKEEVSVQMDRILTELFENSVEELDEGVREILKEYCRRKNICRDFVL